jgi:hypothetical protein
MPRFPIPTTACILVWTDCGVVELDSDDAAKKQEDDGGGIACEEDSHHSDGVLRLVGHGVDRARAG